MFNTPITQSIKRLNNSREGYKTMEITREEKIMLSDKLGMAYDKGEFIGTDKQWNLFTKELEKYERR